MQENFVKYKPTRKLSESSLHTQKWATKTYGLSRWIERRHKLGR